MKTTPIQFVLAGIKTEKFIIRFTPDNENIEFGSQVQFVLDMESKIISCKIGLVFIQEDKEFLEIEVSCNFKISDMSWESMSKKTKNRIVIPKGFSRHLAVLTMGATRGILFAKTENVLPNPYVVPTINIAEMIMEDVIFEI